MAARSAAELGVTMPVNVAAKMARRKRKCLIADMDASRDAVAKVFDVEGKDGPARTCINGLYVWSAGSFRNGGVPMAKKLEAAPKHFDKIIVYWPEAGAGEDEVVDRAGAAILCGGQGNGMVSLREKLSGHGCVMLQ
jgi:hypothetical protein